MPRKDLDGSKLSADVARLLAADKIAPPQARPSLMDAVRAFCGFIETRSKLGWTDGMIAAVLTEAGYPIGTATLRSYRKRMRDEGLLPPLTRPDIPDADAMPVAAGEHTAAVSSKQELTTGAPAVSTAAPDANGVPTAADAAAARPPPPSPQRRSLIVNQSRLPSNEA